MLKQVPHLLANKGPCRFSRHGPSSGRKGRYTRSKASGFNVSSAYDLKGDMDLCSPVDAVRIPVDILALIFCKS